MGARAREAAAVRCQRARRRHAARREATRREIEALDAAMGRLAKREADGDADGERRRGFRRVSRRRDRDLAQEGKFERDRDANARSERTRWR